LADLAKVLVGVVDTLQVDFVDGQFVPHQSWPFTAADVAGEWERLGELPSSLALEFDCMVMAPEQYLDILAAFQPVRIIAHYGSTAAWDTLQAHAAAHHYELGLALTNDVPLAEIYPLLEQGITFVQVMGIAAVGQQGQPFDDRTLTTLRTLRSRYPDLVLAVDGSVNLDTAARLVAAGANQLAPGSAVAKADDPAAAVAALRAATAL
jgi:ribulose-phosphate 3-epimerase